MSDRTENQTNQEDKLVVEQKSIQGAESLPSSTLSEGSGELTNEKVLLEDDILEQPQSMEDVYKKSKTGKNRSSPTKICRKCLHEAYGGLEYELRAVCQDDFIPVFNKLKPTTEFPDIVSQLILYCKSHQEFDVLWEIIKEERPKQYERYYSEWQKAVKNNIEKTDWSEQNVYEEYVSDLSRDSVQQSTVDERHPLTAENNKPINDWFFGELNQQEQSLVLTVALFEGINRKLLNGLTHEIESTFFDIV